MSPIAYYLLMQRRLNLFDVSLDARVAVVLSLLSDYAMVWRSDFTFAETIYGAGAYKPFPETAVGGSPGRRRAPGPERGRARRHRRDPAIVEPSARGGYAPGARNALRRIRRLDEWPTTAARGAANP